MSVLFLAPTPVRAHAVVQQCALLLEHSERCIVAGSDRARWVGEGLDPRVRFLDLPGVGGRRPSRALAVLLMWPAVRTRVLPLVTAERVEHVVVADSHAIPIGWQIARKHPDLDVWFGLDRTGWAGPGPTDSASV